MARSMFGDIPPKVSSEDGPSAPRSRRKPIIKGGATSSKYITAATQGGSERTYQEIFLDQIQDSPIRDRIDLNEDIDSLIESIRDNGQQIPIHVRVVQGDTPYEIVVGRRRLNALRKLGHTKIKAFVSKLDDREAFIAQGIENSARLETSYIERARAAAQSIAAGYEQVDAAQFLNLSRTMLSFMVKAFEHLGEELVVAIGPARGIGRRKWDALIKYMSDSGMTPQQALDMVDTDISNSAERFEALLRALTEERTKTTGLKKKNSVPAKRDKHLNGAITTTRKPYQLTITTNETVPDHILDEINQRVIDLVKELTDKKE